MSNESLSLSNTASDPGAGSSSPTAKARSLKFAWQPFWTGLIGASGAIAALQLAGWPAALVWALLASVAAGLLTPTARTARLPAGPSQEPHLRLPRTVVPIWERNIEAAREHAEGSSQQLLESFASVVDHLDSSVGQHASTVGIQPGTLDELIARHQPELDTLLSTTRLAVALKDQMFDGVQALEGTLQEMAVLAREVQSISRATHLLALNASVEATRASGSGEGFAVVASEVRRLAAQSRQAGIRLGDHVDAMTARIHGLSKAVRKHDTEDDEITLQAEENARHVMRALLKSTGEFVRASRALQESSRTVQDDLEKIMVSLQSQDRLSQMLAAVTDDMKRLGQWLDGAHDPLAHSPTQWLDRLERSYTMEEQRSSHHNTVAIDKQAAVEFF